MFKTMIKAALAVSVIAPAGLAMAEGDPENGKKLFRRCQACHVVDKEQNRVGPHLNGLFGRKVAGVDSYNYSNAMEKWAEDKDVWTKDLLVTYLEKPMEMVKGTKMAFPGLPDEQDRRDVAAYIESAGS